MEIDEDFIQIKTLADKVANTVLDAYNARFRKFDAYEKSVILNSILKILSTFLMSLRIEDRVFAIQTVLAMVEKLMVVENQNE